MKTIDEIADLYNQRLSQALPDHKIVGWGSEESQNLRFQVLAGIASLNGASVLDVGCGLGGFLNFCDRSEIRLGSYTGIDIADTLVSEASSRFAGRSNVQFKNLNILQMPDTARFDFVICSGAFNLKMADNWAMVSQTLLKMHNLAIRGVACNFLTSYVDFSHEKDFHYDPARMFSLVRSFARRVSLIHDYPLYEFTLYIRGQEDL